MTSGSRYEFGARERNNVEILLRMAMAEDLGQVGDITSTATIPSTAQGSGVLVARSAGVLAGLPVVEQIAAEFELMSHWESHRSDGDHLEPGMVVTRLSGPMRSLLAMERIALNFLQRLSGIATLTARYVSAVNGTQTKIYDTRKTIPGWRALEKYAVRCGGGSNHRFGLYDAVLIKDNHLAWLDSDTQVEKPDAIATAIAKARALALPGTIIEIEVDTLDQFDVALSHWPDIILLDNLGPERVAEAVRRRDEFAPRIQLEASGGISLENVAALAATGVDRISVGAITHSVPALDLALDLEIPSESS